MMISVRYRLMDPTGNLTILVETPVAEKDQPAVAAALMKTESKAEQVGFLSLSHNTDISLRMAGGEFCGNATMCAAVCHAQQAGVTEETIHVSVSGAADPVEVQVTKQDNELWCGKVCMPIPESIQNVTFENGCVLPVVSFQGISHVILEKQVPRSEAERLAVKWCKELDADALGLLFLDKKCDHLSPLVYVPAVNTLFWESTCASGTTAIGAWAAKEQNSPVSLTLHQPGGALTVSASPDDSLWLKGQVSCLSQNEIRFSL